MRLEILDRLEDWQAIEPETHELALRQPDVTPFVLPDWQLTWWAHFGSGALQILTFREGNELTGFVPLFRHEWNGNCQLTLVGTGLSDWTDPILPEAALPLVQEYLDRNPSWQVLDWQDLSASSGLASLSGLETRDDTPCSEVPFSGSFDEFWQGRGKDLRRNVRRYGERAAKSGPVEFHATSSAEPSLLDALVRLHGERWQQQGEAGMIAANHAEAFLREVAQRFAHRGLLRILYLRFRGQVTAINLGILLRGIYFAYMSAFDPAQESFGFGRMLLYESFRYCFEQRIRTWNFLRGQEAYKASWGALVVPKIRLYKAR